MPHHRPVADPATANHDCRAWLAAALRRERERFGRPDTIKHMLADLFTLERDAANAEWITAAERTIPTRCLPSRAARWLSIEGRARARRASSAWWAAGELEIGFSVFFPLPA